MAKISIEDIKVLSSEDILQFTLVENVEDLPEGKIKNYILSGKEDFSMSNKFNRVESLMMREVFKRFINGKLCSK